MGFFLIFGIPAVRGIFPSVPSASTQSRCGLAILASPNDPYYPLAEEIAAAENAPVVHGLAEMQPCPPIFLLWVVSPAYLSDARMIEFGLAAKESSAAISSGIITASSLERARALWERRAGVRGQNMFAVNAPNPSAQIPEGRMLRFAQTLVTAHPLTRTGFLNALQSADYLTFTGHGANDYLKLGGDDAIAAADIPALNAVVVGTGSCQTLRPWNEDSIALRFVDQGAAAYSGFVFSPNEGYLIGEFDGLPYRYTWPGFPVGHVLRIQNRGTLQGFANFPFLVLLGDPRTALQNDPPYQLVDDRRDGDRRIQTYRNVPSGVVPLRIAGGAAYEYVEAPGLTAASDSDPFYNGRMQMVDIGEDKFILLANSGGNLTLRMRLRAPAIWLLEDLMLDSLDHTLIFIPQQGGDIAAIVFAVLPLAGLGGLLFRKKLRREKLFLAVGIGIAAAVLHAGYALVRLEQVTITSKGIVFSPLGILATCILSACGAALFLQTHSRIGKAAALWVAAFCGWAPMAFGFLIITSFNMLVFMPATGVALYNYSLCLLPAFSCLLMVASFGVILWTVDVRSADRTAGKQYRG